MMSDPVTYHTDPIEETASKYPLDINFMLDDELLYKQDITDIKTAGIGSFDIYINDKLYVENVGDFCEEFYLGTKVEIRNINTMTGYEFSEVNENTSWKNYGVAIGSLSGIIGETSSGPNEILLCFTTVPIEPDEPVTPETDPEVTFSLDAGSNIAKKNVELYAPAGYTIYYSTDGSNPTTASNQYTGPLSLSANASVFAAESDKINVGNYKIYDNKALPKAITIKAIAVSPDGTATPIATRTYLFQTRDNIAVISISTDFSNLLDYDTGIMVKGAIYDSWVQTPEAQTIISNDQVWKYQGNYTQSGKAWERPATIEIFDGDTYLVENCGIRLRGGVSRMYAQKSFNIYFKKDYGSKELKYSLFPDATDINGNILSAYKGFMLRSGGNDTEYLKFHDTLIQHLANNLDVATQASRPAILYINGEYMGIIVMQEKYSDRYIADHFDVDKDNVIFIEEGEVDEGKDADISLYEELISYADKDMSDPNVYNDFCNIVDITSMLDYYATEIYIGNADWWLTKNTRIWRVRTPENESYGDGKWRWMFYDMEYSSSLYNQDETAYNYDSFTRAMAKDKLFASVMKNADFRTEFIRRIQHLSEYNFLPDNVSSTIGYYESLYKPYMSNYYKRFGDTAWAWNSNISSIKKFFTNRATYIMKYINDYKF